MRRPLAIVLAGLALAGLLAGCDTGERDDDVTEANVQLRLAPDGALLVAERLTFEYTGAFEASYRDINLKHGEQITNVSVREDDRRYRSGGCTVFGCTDADATFGAEQRPNGVRIVWHHKAADDTRTFTVTYRVNRAVVAHDDVIDVGWQVWGDQWEDDLPRLTAEFANPALNPDDDRYHVFAAPRDVEGDTTREQGRATLEAEDVPADQFVDFRVTVPRTPQQGVAAAQVESGPGLPEILASEEKLDDEYNEAFDRFRRWLSRNYLLLSLLLAGLAIGVLFLLTRMAREHPTSTPEHLPEPPDDASPAVAYGLAHEGADSTNTVLATLLDLVERGYYDSKSASTEDEKLDLALSVAKKRPSAAELEPHEKEVLSFFDELLGSETVPMSEMKDKIPEHDDTWRGRWQDMTSALDSAEEDQLDWDRSLNGIRWLLVPALLVLFAVIALNRIDLERDASFLLSAGIGLVTIVVVMAWPSRRLKRLAPKFGERVSKWAAFERWTEDFPRLEDDPPATLDLWKKILIYGVAFGTAERMIESGRIPAPVMKDTSSAWSTYYFAGGASDFGPSFSSGFSSQVAPESSSSGGSSFSGGGGGGFSGGGGGGSW